MFLFKDFFPSESAGDGLRRKPYYKESDGQGLGLKLRRYSCQNCGFTGCDSVRHDHSGGTLDGNGALGATSLQSDGDGDQQSGDGLQAHSVGGGCPLCGSKNYMAGNPRYNEFQDRKDTSVLR